MTAIKLEKVLIHKIAEINDESFLNAIKTILNSKAYSRIFPYSGTAQRNK